MSSRKKATKSNWSLSPLAEVYDCAAPSFLPVVFIAEFKTNQGFEYTYGGILWFCMNRLPKFGGDDVQWVYDRIMVILCKNVIPKEKQDKELLEKLYAEQDGIIYKAIKTLQTVIGSGYRFSEPESVQAARKEYLSVNNTFIGFHEECMCR